MVRPRTPIRPIHEVRSATDRSLRTERQRADEALKAELVGSETRTEEKVGGTREVVDEQIDQAREHARAEVDVAARKKSGKRPAVRPEDGRAAEEAIEKVAEKSKEAVEEIAETSKQAIEAERRDVDDERAREREDAKRAFFDILARERRETNASLDHERGTADSLLLGRDEVLAVVSHDLSNMLTAMKLKAAILERDLPDDGSRPRTLATEIRSACAVMERWANDLLDLANLDAGGGLHVALGEHDPKPIVEESVQMLLARASAKGLSLRAETDGGVPPVRCDRERIVQVMTNLLGNAVKFTRAGSVVARVERASDTEACFSVRDTGTGIRGDLQPRIFERGFHSESGRGGGAGLGLYISKQVIEKHGGRIWVESEEGHGCTFKFTLPLSTAVGVTAQRRRSGSR